MVLWTLVSFAQKQSVSSDTLLMGSRFAFTAVGYEKEKCIEAIHAAELEVIRIEKLISSWDENSQTHEVNSNAGVKPVKVDIELFNLIERSKKVSALTNGFFDVSYASIDKVWDFTKTDVQVPSESEIENSVAKINYQNIELDRELLTVFLKEKGMKIGFGAIGKGYAANRAKQVMVDLGIESGVVNAGGDLISWGKKPDGREWAVGIADPKEKNTIKLWLNVSNMAVVTSGNYERYLIIEGKRYCHIINPKTGWPVKGLSSVTIICPDAELADALATSVFVLGAKEGLDLINKLKGIECLLIDDEGELHYSENLLLNYVAEKN